MGHLYTVIFDNISVSAAQDLWMIAPATNKPIVVHGWELSNVGGTADAGDAQEELLRLNVIRGLATVGSGGTSAAADTHIAAANPGDPAASFTARVNDTTVAVVGAGTTTNMHASGLNIRVPTPTIFTPETRPICTAGQTRLVIRLTTAPADAVSMSGTLWVEELG